MDDLAGYYDNLPRSQYLIIQEDDQVVACGGFGPISDTVCELQKLYVAPAARRKGYASQLIREIEERARSFGYQQIYLESSTKLVAALKLYEKMGYRHLAQPLTQETGHYLMDVWMVKDLNVIL
ncbi:GNAT family N-acetyltransferase [Streptococcus rupicaprae]|uniref:GNAT family N-acetyltransferase n=1 Tax=Streptococcus rupicaprae TaxID=759619 RepID=UPI003396CE5F